MKRSTTILASASTLALASFLCAQNPPDTPATPHPGTGASMASTPPAATPGMRRTPSGVRRRAWEVLHAGTDAPDDQPERPRVPPDAGLGHADRIPGHGRGSGWTGRLRGRRLVELRQSEVQEPEEL
jgi:hypothetical protein